MGPVKPRSGRDANAESLRSPSASLSIMNPADFDDAVSILSGTSTERSKALQDLIEFFRKRAQTPNQPSLASDAYHGLLEALFQCTLTEKQGYFRKTTKSTATTKLTKCGEALRLAVEHGAPRMKRKMARAIIDHITQTLPGPNQDYIEPLMKDYLKALLALLGQPANVEQLAALEGEGWITCIDFLVDAISQYLGNGGRDTELSTRASPAPSFALTPSLTLSTARSSILSTHRSTSQSQQLVLQDLVQGILLLVSASNAPLACRSADIMNTLVQVLHLKQLNLSWLHRAAFTALNHIIPSVQVEESSLTNSLTRDLLPLLSHWWYPSSSATQSESINSVRDQIICVLYSLRLNLEALILQDEDETLERHVEDVLDALWSEYSKRDERTRLQIGDLSFAPNPTSPFLTKTFSLRRFDIGAERRWGVVEILAILDNIHARATKNRQQRRPEGDDQPRKRRRVIEAISKSHESIRSSDLGVQLTGLQVITFQVQKGPDDCAELLPDMMEMISHKQANISSWAMIACACYGQQSTQTAQDSATLWKQVWQVSVRCMGLPGGTRAACLVLHTILDFQLIPSHSIMDDINNIITSADTSGPTSLVDSSLSLMLHLLHMRNSVLPNASQATCGHIVRWMFSNWKPVDASYAAVHSVHASPVDIVNLLMACIGDQPLSICDLSLPPGGLICQTWARQAQLEPLMRYLLMLETPRANAVRDGAMCQIFKASNPLQATDPADSNSAKKLILELLSPVAEEFLLLTESWVRKGTEAASQLSTERWHALVSFCITAALLVPQLQGLNSSMSRQLESTMDTLFDNLASSLVDSGQNQGYLETCLGAVSVHMPALNTSSLESWFRRHTALQKLLQKISAALKERTLRHSSAQHQDVMDLDDEFESQASQNSSAAKISDHPRQDLPLAVNSEAFYLITGQRLRLLVTLNEDDQIGILSGIFVDQLLSLPEEDIILCRHFLQDLFGSDLVITPDDALKLVESAGGIISENQYSCCEVALGLCLDVMEGLISLWTEEKLEVYARVGDLYTYLIKQSLPKNSLSPIAQIRLGKLLYRLLEIRPAYGNDLGLPSCRSSLLKLLQEGNMLVKYFIGTDLPKIFALFVLKVHDDIFIDILNSLPSDGEKIEGIALRLLSLAGMACKWPTLLRRCIYHIFETPGRLENCTKYASRCLNDIAEALALDSARSLFKLFAPQLLYTWLEEDSIEDIPYEIFGFPDLNSLLELGQAEASALMIMRGQDEQVKSLSQMLGVANVELVKNNFTKIIAYSIAHDVAVPKDQHIPTGESRVRKLLGKEPFLECLYLNFVDIVALFFDLFDQEDPIEKYFAKEASLQYANEVMAEIKSFGHAAVTLPPNQQPMFKAKFLVKELLQLCSRTEYELATLWSPALVVLIARKLFNTIHPALGSLHACSVLRKVRVLICLAGSQATSSYPLEMLLHSIRPFIQDSECADDALGISQYLISRGTSHLAQSPSFFAGYALSTLASLRMFLESSQSSTTQESQFKATMTKAQLFHGWFTKHLNGYDSPTFSNDGQRQAFRSIIRSASNIRTSGNAEKGTHESNLLMEILKDGDGSQRLLNNSAKDLTLGMLCGDFRTPQSSRADIIETDDDAVTYNAAVWRSCGSQSLQKDYLTWAGRVIGRAFAASGKVDEALLLESRVSGHGPAVRKDNGSEQGLLDIVGDLTTNKDGFTAGLAESALRTIVTEAVANRVSEVLLACQNSLPEALLASSDWNNYQTPPSDCSDNNLGLEVNVFESCRIGSTTWSQDLAVHLARCVPGDVVLAVLPPILHNVKGFADQALPFIIHLVLFFQLDKQQVVKRTLSEAIRPWLQSEAPEARDNIKLLINVVVYLRTQALPNESSIADRSQWLDVDLALAAAAATRCGMFKTGLMFAEIAMSDSARTSRRSSAARDLDSTDATEVLLDIFENIDDPDAYYGLPQAPDLSNILSRLEYEKDGSKSLAFRGAQYDSHLQQRRSASDRDARSLVEILGNLGLSGLSHSLLQTQQSLEGMSDSFDSTFTTARRLGIWNLPTPPAHDSQAVTLYKAYQGISQATDAAMAQKAVHNSLGNMMLYLASHNLNVSTLRRHLGALAALTELDDILSANEKSDLESMLSVFEDRSKWMLSGRYEDVGQILSCRETSLRALSRQDQLRGKMKISPGDARLVEIRGMILSSGIYRFHHARQESLNLATSLTDMIDPTEAMGLNVDAAIKMETANALWDHGEMIPSIRMLQSIDKESALKKQAVPVMRSDLLSKIGHQVSVAKLESPDSIQKKYLEPALKELKGKSEGKEAGKVFHQFAMFCDEQLQNPDGLEDLARLQNLKKGKSDEVTSLKSLIASTKDSQMKNKYASHLSKARQWLELDQQELRRVEQTRTEFVRLSLENYLLSLIASDENNNDALRFTALWLERSEDDGTNDAVRKHLDTVPTRKFAPLVNQLTSRLQEQNSVFQRLLINLVFRICIDHPYHAMYQIWSGVKTRYNKNDDVAIRRFKATEKISHHLTKAASVAPIWQAIDRTSRAYHALATERDPNRYKAGQKMGVKESQAGVALMQCLVKYQIPPPTLQIDLSADKDYSSVPMMTKLEPTMSIASGVSAPKIITAVGSNGERFKQLVKGGNDDLRQDAIMEQVFAAVSSLLKLHRTTRQRNLGIRTYKVLPLTAVSGLIEFVPNTIPLHEYLMPAHEKYYPKDLKGSHCRKEISNVQSKTIETRVSTYRKVTERFHPVMRYFFMEYFPEPDEWFAKRLAYTRSTAAISMLGHVLGLGDRHGHNILLDSRTGEVVHIDLGVAFEMGRVLPVPELVPFRMTRDIVDGMGITKTEGVFRRCCEFTMDAMREETYSIMTILDVLRYDPLYSWSISPVRLAKLQDARRMDDTETDEQSEMENRKVVNEPSEADRALEVVRKKLSKTLSVTATVNDLINQATDERNLAVLYSGWAAYA